MIDHTNSNYGPSFYRHREDTAVCLDMLQRGIAEMKAQSLQRYCKLLSAARFKVYGEDSPRDPAIDTPDMEVRTLTGNPASESMPSFILGPREGLENYANEVTEFFDLGMGDIDDGLQAWYGSVMHELQPNVSSNAIL